MIELTVGYVAGLLAFGSFIIQLWSPNTIAFILAGILKDNNTAATWSVAGRALQNTYWPDLLRIETSRIVGVRTDVIVLTKLMRVMAILVAIAGTVTPLGLYEQFVPAKKITATFRYLKDTSPFGLGTPPRSGLPFGRKCDQGNLWGFPIPCPFSNTVVILTSDGDVMGADLPYSYNTSIPDILLDIYSSGTSNSSTISNFFDIEWRQWTTRSNNLVMNGSLVAVGAYRSMQSMVLNNNTDAVEGLIVDTINGGIGFRNHTVPIDLEHGATWTEDLLFVEPETSCIDTNLTLDWTVTSNDTDIYSVTDLVLTDRGGFANLNHTYPYYDRNDSQRNPDLPGRAYKAAWLNNAWTMMYLNITNPNNSTPGAKAFSYLNSHVGKTFPMTQSTGDSGYTALRMTNVWGEYLNINGFTMGNSGPNISYKNPFHVSTDDFDSIQIICQGIGDGDVANITNIFGACGLMYGAAQRVGGGSSAYVAMEAGSKWTIPLYACASAVKATIKTASFNLNGTKGQDLKALSVTGVQPKNYTDQASMPLWGVEDSGWNYTEIGPLWGLISSAYEHHPNVSSVRKESLYLPGGPAIKYASGYSCISYQNMPGTDFYMPAMFSAYGSTVLGGVDYTGYQDMGMWVRWQNLSASPQTASQIVNLVWTDGAAGAVVGTKGTLGPGNKGSGNDVVDIQVEPYVQRIKYHWLFGIPAYILLAMVVIITVIALLTSIFHNANISTMRHHLFRSSAGRIYAAFMFPDYCDLRMPALEWRRAVGKEMIDLGEDSERITSIAARAARKSLHSPYEGSNLIPYEGT